MRCNLLHTYSFLPSAARVQLNRITSLTVVDFVEIRGDADQGLRAGMKIRMKQRRCFRGDATANLAQVSK